MSVTVPVSLTALTPEEYAAYDRDGFHVARGLLSRDEAAQIGRTFTDLAAGGPVPGLSEVRHGGRDAYDPNDPLARFPRMMFPHTHPELPVGPLAMRYMLDRRLEGPLRDLFGGVEPLAVQSMFYFKPPGARGQDLHQDNFYLRVKPGTCMAAWVAVDDADESNGGMVVVPGTHRDDVACPEKADPAKFFTTEHVPVPAGRREQAVTLRAGDVLFFNGSLIHGSYPNTSADRFRRSLIFHYVPDNSIELAHYYRTPMRFDGTVVSIAEATGGGPCGTLQPAGIH